jgi:hypothetical protein
MSEKLTQEPPVQANTDFWSFTSRALEVLGGIGLIAFAGPSLATAATAIGTVTGIGMVAHGGYGGYRVAKSMYDDRTAKSTATSLAVEEADTLKSLGAEKDAGEREKLGAKLDDNQKRHIQLMDWVYSNDVDLPLPDAGSLSKQEYAQVQTDWRTLCKGEGHVQLSGKVSDNLQAEIRAMHAKLLSGPNGRKMMHAILNPDTKDVGPIIIEPLPRDASTAEQRKLRAKFGPVMEKEGKELTERLKIVDRELDEAFKNDPVAKGEGSAAEKRRQYYSEQYEELVVKPKQEYQQKIQKLKIEKLGGASSLTPPNPGLASANGKKVTLREGLRDAEFVAEGEAGAYIPSPSYIIYGHELSHATRRRQKIVAPLPNEQLDSRWHDYEEVQNITGDKRIPGISENDLRADHKLPKRKFHTSWALEEVEHLL